MHTWNTHINIVTIKLIAPKSEAIPAKCRLKLLNQ